jgi:hypothetical protein
LIKQAQYLTTGRRDGRGSCREHALAFAAR